MKFPFLAIFIVFVIWLSYELRKAKKREKKGVDEYWAREQEANNTRKKPLDDLEYIKVPLDFIPKSLMADHAEVQECVDILTSLSSKKIVNFSGMSNTDLKLTYGSPNLPLLTEYDDNYILFARTIFKLAKAYYEGGYRSNSLVLLEYGVKSGSDIKANYTLLAQIYRELEMEDKIKELISLAADINSINQKAIIHSLEEFSHTDS